MSYIAVSIDAKASVVPSGDVHVGQIGVVEDFNANQGAIVLRTYDGFVNLREPNQTWNTVDRCFDKVRLLPAGTPVTLRTSL